MQIDFLAKISSFYFFAFHEREFNVDLPNLRSFEIRSLNQNIVLTEIPPKLRWVLSPFKHEVKHRVLYGGLRDD